MHKLTLTDWEYDMLRILTRRQVGEVADNLYRSELQLSKTPDDTELWESIKQQRTTLEKYSGLLAKLGENER